LQKNGEVLVPAYGCSRDPLSRTRFLAFFVFGLACKARLPSSREIPLFKRGHKKHLIFRVFLLLLEEAQKFFTQKQRVTYSNLQEGKSPQGCPGSF